MQNDFYDTAVKKIVDGVLQGYNGTVFAYGQTGAGKTTTIQGQYMFNTFSLTT